MRESRNLIVLGFVLVVAVCIVGADVLVSAQNTNSSTTMDNANTGKAKTTGRRRGTRKKPANTNAEASTEMQATENANANTGMKSTSGRRRRGSRTKTATTEATTAVTTETPKRTGRCDPTQQEQTDLSGTYTGKLKHGDEPVMDATLTVTGNNFTGTMGSETHSGRITAVTTCGYTAVTMMMDGAPKAVSLRAKKVGDNLTLTSVPGEPQTIMFTTGGGAMKSKPRKHKAKAKTAGAAATPTP